MTHKIDAWARRQLADYQSNKPGTIFRDEGFHITINEAYAIQDTMVKLRLQKGETIAGYKVGCTGPGITKLFGMQGPIRGTLFNQEIHQSGATLNLNQFDNLAIEAEMAFQTGAGGEINSVFPVIELHNFVFRAPKKSLSELIANNGLNKGIILPDQNWKGLPNIYGEKSILSLEVNGAEIDAGNMWPMDGGPRSSLDWLTSHLAEYDLKMASGNIVLGGTALGMHLVQSEDHIVVKIGGKTAVQCRISVR